MRHYVILMEEKLFLPNNYTCWHYIKRLEGNEIPEYELPEYLLSVNRIRYDLVNFGFKEKPAPTIQEIILNDVAIISLIIWDGDGNYKQIGKFERKV